MQLAVVSAGWAEETGVGGRGRVPPAGEREGGACTRAGASWRARFRFFFLAWARAAAGDRGAGLQISGGGWGGGGCMVGGIIDGMENV